MLSDASFRIIKGPYGSGKSTGMCVEILRRCISQPPTTKDNLRHSRWAVIRNTADQLRDTTLKTWFEWFPPGEFGTWRATERTFYLSFNDVRAEILFRALDDPDDVRKLKSLELTGAWLNEACEIHPDIIGPLRKRVGRYPRKDDVSKFWSGVIADTNAPMMDSWWMQMMEKIIPNDWAVFHQPSGRSTEAENLEHLQDDYYSTAGLTEDEVRVQVDGVYGLSQAGKPVYEKTYIHDFHGSQTPLTPICSAQYPLIIGMDFGRTPACVVGQVDHRGRVLVFAEAVTPEDESMGLERFLAQFVRPLLAQPRFAGHSHLIVGDPSGWARSQQSEDSCADILRKAMFKAVRASTNKPELRINAVEALLAQQIDGKAAFLVDVHACPKLVGGFRYGYRYKKTTKGLIEELPDKNHFSHVHDAMQYFALQCRLNDRGLSLSRPTFKIVVPSAAGWT